MDKGIFYFFIVLLLILLLVFIFTNCAYKEKFTAPGLTLVNPPSWFPENAAKKYNKKDWETKMYLDRYPFYDTLDQDYLPYKESNELASIYRYWKQ